MSVEVNDILEELREENKRLLNELLFSDKFIDKLIKFKAFVETDDQLFRSCLNSSQLETYEELSLSVDCVHLTYIRLKSIQQSIVNGSDANNNTREKMEKKKQIDDKMVNEGDVEPEDQSESQDKNKVEEERVTKLGDNLKNRAGNESDAEERAETVVKAQPIDMVFMCSGCGHETTDMLMMEDHITEAHIASKLSHRNPEPDSPSKNPLAVFTGMSMNLSTTSMSSPPKKGLLVCRKSGCGLTFRNRVLMRNHKKKVHSNYDFECTYEGCAKKYKTQYHLTRHVNYAHRVQPLTLTMFGHSRRCRKTKKRVKNAITITNKKNNGLEHLVSEVGLSEPKIGGRPEDTKRRPLKRFSCDWPQCQRVYCHNKSLREHKMSVHLKIKPYACKEQGCHFRSAFLSNLHVHRRTIHSANRRKYRCLWPDCGRVSYKESTINEHRRQHLAIQVYP